MWATASLAHADRYASRGRLSHSAKWGSRSLSPLPLLDSSTKSCQQAVLWLEEWWVGLLRGAAFLVSSTLMLTQVQVPGLGPIILTGGFLNLRMLILWTRHIKPWISRILISWFISRPKLPEKWEASCPEGLAWKRYSNPVYLLTRIETFFLITLERYLHDADSKEPFIRGLTLQSR